MTREQRLGRALAALAMVVAGLTVAGTGTALAGPAVAGPGLAGPGVAGQAATDPAASGFPAKADLAGRDRKSTSATEVKTYPAGSTVLITCQAYGEYAYGSPIWDRTTDDLWVADHYVKTGSDGFVPGMPRCDNDEPSGGSVDCAAGHGRITGPRGSTAGTAAERIARAIATARTQTGKSLSYSWGAGGKGGAACGISSPSPGGYVDYERFGYDCSGYTLYAFWKGAGVDIGAYTGAQYNTGRRVPYAQRQPGDLIFWGSGPTDTTHVAIYLGNDRILEAAPPRGTDSVHETTVYGSTRLGSVVRVLG